MTPSRYSYAMVAIVKSPNPVLRAHAHKVTHAQIGSPELTKVIAGMKQALSKERHGVAIAAPQIGVSLRLFVVAAQVFAIQEEEDFDAAKHVDHVYINPEIISRSRKHTLMNEGCLSVSSTEGTMVWGEVSRAEKVRMSALDEFGKKHLFGASGLLAQVFQHEVDHLDGILYIDKAAHLYEEKAE